MDVQRFLYFKLKISSSTIKLNIYRNFSDRAGDHDLTAVRKLDIFSF